ncbi:hypothetical protein [Halorussus sp. MSC15.2]|uniref:hypothetical protein n=1 Tax=Halorussus sp. MSC15.2 TaxID=2283638 RepID=UPI0013D0C12F|nr:hypothetical protein [Halorussus sp. MSC15.2]NEU59220.1 hypothetical protein [Halorussus sp. MSC15.2]
MVFRSNWKLCDEAIDGYFGVSEQSTEPAEPTDDVSNTGQFNRSDLLFKLRRDKVKDERENVHQLFVQNETEADEQDARRNLDDRFDESIYKLDAREAIYLAGMQNPDDAEDILRDWGYDL